MIKGPTSLIPRLIAESKEEIAETKKKNVDIFQGDVTKEKDVEKKKRKLKKEENNMKIFTLVGKFINYPSEVSYPKE